MARFLDLEDDDDEVPPLEGQHLRDRFLQTCRVENQSTHQQDIHSDRSSEAKPPHPPIVDNAVTEAFQCYPVVVAVASSIDLNTLDSLSRTTHRIHDGLVQNRNILLRSTLHCQNDGVPVDPDDTFRFRARAGNWFYNMEDAGRTYNGKSGHCARDMVSECRRCASVVCRNCAIKPPAPKTLKDRHRRLCTACDRAPIATLASPTLNPDLSLHSEAVQRGICKCASEGVWLCQPCGRSMRSSDQDYQQLWKWRSAYGENLGCLGVGIAEGDRGMPCGREGACSAAKDREQEVDCDAEDAKGGTSSAWATDNNPFLELSGTPPHNASSSPPQALLTPNSHTSTTPPLASAFVLDDLRSERTPSPQLGPGYERHEIVGIGGIVKRKLTRMVSVGACVPVWQDEKSSGKMLQREIEGESRSWCGWCWRVIPGEKDETQGSDSS